MRGARPPKRIRKQLRELATLAYERDLNRELESLAVEFDRWRREELSPWELSEHIHRFHQGPARDLFVFYRDMNEATSVGYALANGVLREDEIPGDVFSHVESTVAFYRKAWDEPVEGYEEGAGDHTA